jgi:hypothetical protein
LLLSLKVCFPFVFLLFPFVFVLRSSTPHLSSCL